jgi:hypothetical protein
MHANNNTSETGNLELLNDPRSHRWLIGTVGIYIVLVLNLLEPFGITIASGNMIYHLFLTSYGIISSLTIFLWLRYVQPKLSQSAITSTPLKLASFLLLLVLLVSLSNWLYSQLLHHTISGWRNMYIPIRSFSDLMPQFVALYSLWWLLSWSHLYYLQKNLLQAPSDENNERQIITFYSENKSDGFKIKQQQFVCLKTCDNYLEVYYLNESNELQNRLIRSSMKKMAQHLDQKNFFRPHQSFIVNLIYVVGLKKVKNNHLLEVSHLDFDLLVTRKQVNYIKSYLTR